ncbi:MAG TPA: flagellar basal body-associated FliL family protein [Steroidobacteraceae bacterium]|jgi:flagellar FliL protein|nr:flagellar basal body-associated FliL family protein [Steroidobacteraceae bacterium]
MAAPPSAPAAAAAAAPVAAAAPRKKPWLLIGIAGGVLLACGGTGAWLLMAHNAPKKTAAAAPAPPAGPPLYVALDPPFVSNFEGDQQVRFLQVTAQIMTHDPKTVEALKAADPIIRNDLLMLFSNQKAADLATNDGKEKLRAAALAAVRKVLAQNDGKPEKVDAVLFTTFVMQ